MVSKKEDPSNPSYRELLEQGVARLYEDFETPRIDAEVLLQHALDKDLSWFIVNAEHKASDKHIEAFTDLVDKRAKGEPIAYITGHKEFWSLDLMVNPLVLIPRPDTETLVELALELLPVNDTTNVLDLGTGSGAIALAIAKEQPKVTVLATDSSQLVLEVAQLNAKQNGLINIEFLLSDWYEQLTELQFDLITANPPYIEPNDPHLSKGDLRFEPSTALIGAGDGLGDICQIIEGSTKHLKNGGCLVIEHGFDQDSQVHDLLVENGFTNIVNRRDLNDLPRCTAGQWQQS